MEGLSGLFPALQATFDAHGELDTKSMERQVAFNIECGTHGLVFPVLGGELKYLSDSERQRLVEVVVGVAAGQVPVVAGVSAPSTPIAVEHARHAARIGADAVIALPTYPESGSREEMRSYFTAIAEAAERPVFIQHTGGGLSASFIAELLREIEWAQYVKEETPPSGHSISAILDLVGDECLGVMGGAHGQWMIPEMRRGASGFVPAAHVTDVYVQVWDAFQNGDEEKARDVFKCLHPMLSLLRLVGLRLCKEILVRRGAISTATMRIPGSTDLDACDRQELELVMRGMETYFSI
jgi:dihydrodipicolinate synthase/N-acetylneuraminate lyase